MKSNTSIFHQSNLSWAFWRIAAFVTGIAVERKRLLAKILAVTPFVAAGAAAYVVGRVLGSAFMNGFMF